MRPRAHILVGAALVLAGGSAVASESEPTALITAPLAATDTMSWRPTAGYASTGLGVAGLAVSAYYAQQISETRDKVAALALEAQTVTTIEDFEQLQARVERVNGRGDRFETAHLSTLIGGLFLTAVGGGLLVWELLETPDSSNPPEPKPDESATTEPLAAEEDIKLSVLPLPAGLLLRWTW